MSDDVSARTTLIARCESAVSASSVRFPPELVQLLRGRRRWGKVDLQNRPLEQWTKTVAKARFDW
ncbi:hypothetical protein T11_11521, partial [Trichinella zimbabwensis]